MRREKTIAIFMHHPMCSIDSVNGVIHALAADYNIKLFTRHKVQEGFFDDVHLVVFPGGDGDATAFRYLLKANQDEVKKFLSRGGRYLGICMGAYWADAYYFDLLKHTRVVQYIKRARADVKSSYGTTLPVLWRGEPRRMYFYDGPTFVGGELDVVATYANGDPMAVVQGAIGLIGCHLESEAHWYAKKYMQPHWHHEHHHALLLQFVVDFFARAQTVGSFLIHGGDKMKISHLISLGLVSACLCTAQAQPKERTIEEIKTESIARAQRGAYPLGGLDPKDVAQALSYIQTRDRDEWAAGWGRVAQEYEKQAQQAKTAKEAAAAYKKAWRLYYFAQWPVPNSPGKQAAYDHGIRTYLKYAEAMDPPLQLVKIPFEGKTITGYLRYPKEATGKVPMILAISGLDSRKETVADSYEQILSHGVGFLAVDGPGTGQAPLKVSATAERMFSAVLDYLVAQPKVDAQRIIVSGVSFGGYWASKLAITEKARLLGSVAQSPPVDEFFSEKFLREGTMGNREYLFDLAPAFINVFEGANSVDDLARLMPAMSLKAQNLLSKPTTPMLLVTGVKDTQVPISDIELLMRSGDVPKEAWINPLGGHLGREAKGWTDPVIFSKVIIPWELRLIEQSRRP